MSGTKWCLHFSSPFVFYELYVHKFRSSRASKVAEVHTHIAVIDQASNGSKMLNCVTTLNAPFFCHTFSPLSNTSFPFLAIHLFLCR